MLFAIWRWIQLWLPFGLIIQIYKYNKSLPTNILTRTGRNLKAIMVTTDYGVLFSEEKYVENRLKKLKEKQQKVFEINEDLVTEINSLSFIEKEKLYGNLKEDINGNI